MRVCPTVFCAAVLSAACGSSPPPSSPPPPNVANGYALRGTGGVYSDGSGRLGLAVDATNADMLGGAVPFQLALSENTYQPSSFVAL